MSGTDLGCDATRRDDLRGSVLSLLDPVSATHASTYWGTGRVLALGLVLTWGYGTRQSVAVHDGPKEVSSKPAISLRSCYAMPGTDRAYDGTNKVNEGTVSVAGTGPIMLRFRYRMSVLTWHVLLLFLRPYYAY
eukprot:209271-Rhodomonas_salina.2